MLTITHVINTCSGLLAYAYLSLAKRWCLMLRCLTTSITSSVCVMNSRGYRTKAWGTLQFTPRVDELFPFTTNTCADLQGKIGTIVMRCHQHQISASRPMTWCYGWAYQKRPWDQVAQVQWQFVNLWKYYLRQICNLRFPSVKGSLLIVLKFDEETTWDWARLRKRHSRIFEIVLRLEIGWYLKGRDLSRPGFLWRGLTDADFKRVWNWAWVKH